MTEAEWLGCGDLDSMLSYLKGDVNERKFRLTECTFLRRFWHLLTDERSRRAVELAERYADGSAKRAELRAAHAEAETAFREILEACPAAQQPNGTGSFYGGAVSAAQHTASSFYDTPELITWREDAERFRQFGNLIWISAAAYPLGDEAAALIGNDAIDAEQAVQAALLHELFGNPFRSNKFAPSWRTKDVANLAQASYEERALPSGHLDNARLAVLSDALEEAGCADIAILTHLRSPGPHVRGCWALDLVLGKE